MSRKTPFIIALALFVAIGCLPVFAQAGTEASQAGQTAQTTEARTQVQSALQRIATELNLTDDQRAKIKPILQDEFNQLKAVGDDASLSSDQKIAKAKEIHAKAKSEIQPILTPEQQTKLATMREHMRQSWEGPAEPPK